MRAFWTSTLVIVSALASAQDPAILIEAPSNLNALGNAAECQASERQGQPVLNLPPAIDPYVLPEFIVTLAPGQIPPDGTFTAEVVFVDDGAGIIQTRVVESEKPRKEFSPRKEGSYTQLNTGTLRSAWFEFSAPSLGANATLRIGNLNHLHAVRIWPALPDERWQAIRASVPQNVTPMVTLQRPMQLVTTAGIDVRGEWDSLQTSLDAMHELAPLAKVLGFTSIESYVTWKRIETAEGQFDFSFYDAIVDKLQSYGLKWSPLVIVGSAYALPDWFSSTDENVEFVCLEHGIENPIQSIWSPFHKRHVTRVLQAFGDHYDGKGILESVRLGPSGNYGESQYPAGGNWGFKGNPMHIHIGWWSADAYGREDFKAFLRNRYAAIADLNAAWKTEYTRFDDVEMALPDTIYVKQRRLDFTTWYTDSMSMWCDWWVREAGKAMPNTLLYQSAGGWGFREAGTDYTAQAKSMIAVKGGIRLTNETDSYEQDFYATRLAATAARLYHLDLGFEPASSHTARGVVGRIYNTTATDGDHLFTYHSNVMNHPLEVEKWLKYLTVLDSRQPPVVEVAIYYPETMNQLDDSAFRHLYAWGFNPRAAAVRRVVDVDYLDERLIREGYLDQYKVLVFAWGDIIEDDVQDLIDAWMRRGGIVIYPSFPKGPLTSLRGSTRVFESWVNGETGEGAFHRFPGDMEPPSLYAEFVRSTLLGLPHLQPLTHVALKGRHPDQVFLTVQEDGHLLVLNYRDEPAPLELPDRAALTLDPYSIQRVAPETP